MDVFFSSKHQCRCSGYLAAHQNASCRAPEPLVTLGCLGQHLDELCMTELITGLQTLKPEQWAFWKLSSYAVKHKHVLQLLETTITDTVPFYWVCQRSGWWGNAGKMTQEEDSGNEWKGETGLAAGTKASIDTRCFLQLTLHFSFTAAEKRQFCAI